MCERWLLKENAKKSLKHFFWSAVLAIVITAAIMVVIGRISGVPEISIRLNPYGSAGYSTELPGYGYATIRGVLGILLSILVGYPISVGLIRFFILNRKESAGLGELFFSFKNGTFANVALITLCQSVFVFLWSLLLIVPGIIKSFEYFFIPYILAERPDIERREAFELSRKMTAGHKFDIFVFELSFFWWYLLAIVTFGIAAIYVEPYTQAAYVELYECLKANMGKNE